MKPHKHAELIKAWADGAEIEYRLLQGFGGNKHWTEWYSTDNDTIKWTEVEGWEYRIKHNNTQTNTQSHPINDGETGELKSAEVLK